MYVGITMLPGAPIFFVPSSDALPGDVAPASPANVGVRVAALHALRMAQQEGMTAADGRVTLDGTQYRLLCEMVGATRESVSIVVNRLIGDGLARRHGAGFLVPSLPDLVARAGASLRGDVVMPIGVEAEADGRLRA